MAELVYACDSKSHSFGIEGSSPSSGTIFIMTDIFTQTPWVVQLIGFVAVCFSFAIFQFNNRKKMLHVSMFGQILYAIHFALLGAFTGSLMNIIGAVRSYLFARIDTKKKPMILFYVFVSMYLIALFFTWKGPISVLPVIGMISGTIAFWQTNPRHIRMIGLISPPLWFTYNFISGSYPGMLAEVVLLSSNLIGIYRFDFLPKFKKSIIKP